MIFLIQVLQQRVLGNGSFGVIVLASDNQGGADVAVKMEVCVFFEVGYYLRKGGGLYVSKAFPV